MSGRLRVSTTTAKPSDRDLRRFLILIEPEDRKAPNQWWPKTVGDALDTKATVCRTRYLMYKASEERVTFLAKACGKASCPYCVVGWLADRAGAAWAYWNGQATMKRVPSSGGNESRAYAKLGITMQGPNATPGVLSVPIDHGRGLFVPVGIGVDGYDVRGAALDKALLETLRAIRFDDAKATDRKAMDHQATIPDRVTDHRFAELAEAAGVPLNVRGLRYRQVLGVDQAAWDRLRQLVKEAR
jgi:hypothetical protein